MGRRISQTMADMFTLGITPLLTAPLALEGNSPNSEGLLDLSHKGGKAKLGGGAAPPQKGGTKQKGREEGGGRREGGGPSWHKGLRADEYVREWMVPEGKKFSDFFGPHKRENVRGLPKVPHHSTRKPTNLCIRYQVGNGTKCGGGEFCSLAHIRPQDMSREVKDKITIHLSQVYSGEPVPGGAN